MGGEHEVKMSEGTLATPRTKINLHYRLWQGSEQKRSMVLVHGLASTLRIWDLVAPLLAGSFVVAAYDQRGHGASDKPDQGYDLDTELTDLCGVIDGLQLDRPVIVGHSWGATLALAYAAAFPEYCSGIALVDGGIIDIASRPGATWENVSLDLAPPVLSHLTLDDLVRRSKLGEFEHLPESFRREFFGSMMEEQADGTIRARLSRENHMKILRTMWDTRSHDLLARVRCPALLIMAASEVEEGSREEQFLHMKRHGLGQAEKLMDDVKAIWMDDTNHDIPLHRPEWLAHELIAFFSSRRQGEPA